jgi:hypothetical protein
MKPPCAASTSEEGYCSYSSKAEPHSPAPSLEDRLGRVMQLVGDLPNGEPVATELPNLGKLVHREHPCLPAVASSPHTGLCYGVSLSEADRVSLPDADYHNTDPKARFAKHLTFGGVFSPHGSWTTADQL